MTYDLRLNVKEITNGNTKFPACTAKYNGQWFKVKFTRECENSPKTRGVYRLVFESGDGSIENGKKFTRKDGTTGIGNATIWVRKITSITKYSDEELSKMNGEELDKVLNGYTEIDTNEELPF